MKTYGYTRISTPKQNIDRQIRNIKAAYPEALIIKEVYTGTTFQGRKELDKLLNRVTAGDTIVFDSVSRMSRTAEDGYLLYESLFEKGINLIFLKEPHINTDTYRQSLKAAKLPISIQSGDEAADQLMDTIVSALKQYILSLAARQIRLAFSQSEKEVSDLRQRTKEGIETARINGKQIGLPKGTKLNTKKSIIAKKEIQKYSKDFEGTLSDPAVIKITGLARNTYYKYKKELKAAL